MDMLAAAKSYATLHHVIRKGQLYGNLPYTHHLERVHATLVAFSEQRPAMHVAAWLHDIVEDTDVKLRDIEENFGEEVARLVAAVTSEEGPNRKVRNALTYPKIRSAGSDAVKLKLADRMSNVTNGGGSVKMYAREHGEFRYALFDVADTNNARIWLSLDLQIDFIDGSPNWSKRV